MAIGWKNEKYLFKCDISKDNYLMEYLVENDMLESVSAYDILTGAGHLFDEIEKLKQENLKLKQENEKLKTEVLYQPGGQGMIDAKTNFEKLAK